MSRSLLCSQTSTPTSFAAIIDLWKPSDRHRSSGHDGFAEACAIPLASAKAMRHRNYIHPAYWKRLIVAARSAGHYGVTADLLVDIADQIAIGRR